MNISTILRCITTSRGTSEREILAQRECALEEEFTRRVRGFESQILLLRAENRALLNSVLGIAGIPPIMVSDPAELPFVGQEPKQIPRTASRAPENREGSNSARDFARDDSSQNNDCPQGGTASLRTDSVGDAPGVSDTATLGIDGTRNCAGEDIAPHVAASPNTVAGHGGGVAQRATIGMPPRKKSRRRTDDGRIVAPMRRRSWHQIYRMLELESTRRKDIET